MSRKMLRVLAVLSLVILSASTVHASGRSFSSSKAGLTSAWEWIAGWLHDVPGLSAVWGEEGSQMDPNGTKTNAGPEVDPNGMHTDEGPGMDPNG